ncbi:MAG: PAC2 family protein [archaeon]
MKTEVILLKKTKLTNPIFITGLPGIGLVGKIVVDYLLRQNKSEKIAEIVSDSFPPSVYTKDSFASLIKDEIHLVRLGKQDFLFLAGPVQPSLDMRFSVSSDHYEFAESIVKAMKKLGVKKIYTLAGINVGDRRMEKLPRVVISSTSKQELDVFRKFGPETVKIDKGEGLISGAAGLIVGFAAKEGLMGTCLMGETNVKLIYGDHGAAKKVLEILIKKFGFKVKMGEIEKEAKEIEQAFSQLAKQLDDMKEEPEEENPKLSYVR